MKKTKRQKKNNEKTKKTVKTLTENPIDIKEIKKKLIEMKENILANLKSYTLNEQNIRDVGDEIDDVTQTMEKEIIFDLSENEKNILKDVEVALKKIENKTFGKCELCKNDIEPKRLNALPYTRYCLKCQTKQDR